MKEDYNMAQLNFKQIKIYQAYHSLVMLYKRRKKNATAFKMAQILTITVFYSNILFVVIAPFTTEMPSELMFYPARKALLYIACTILMSICAIFKRTDVELVIKEVRWT